MVEWLGNLFLYLVMLFVLFLFFIVLFSGIFGYFDIVVVDFCLIGVKGCEEDGMIEVILLMSVEGL